MSKLCPIDNTKVTYLVCQECDDKWCDNTYLTCRKSCDLFTNCKKRLDEDTITPIYCNDFKKKEE